jgi:acyl-CoA thioester hydrolase
MPEETSAAPAPVEIVLPVLWGNMDAFGHVNNTVYFRWFECARIEYLDRAGLSHLMAAQRIGPILAAIDCNFRRQVKHPDTVRITARVTRLGRSSLSMAHEVHSQQQAALVADGTSTIVVFDYRTQRPVRVPDEIRAAMERLEGRELG